VFETASFRLKGYSVLVGERPGLHAGGVWTQTCIFCHNTVPYFDALWGALAGPGAPSYQGEVVDRLLPAARRWRVATAGAGEEALVRAVDDELRFVGVPPPAPSEGGDRALRDGIRALRSRFGPQHFVEIGIGCEACHGGSREHVAEPRVLPDFVPRAPFVATTPQQGGDVTRAEAINRACARCHQVLFSRYPFTWEGGARRGSDPGGSSITSGEARDFLLGGCARQMSCVTCHDPHAEDRRADLARLATVAGNAVCVRCHDRYAAPTALAAHAHHDANGAGASCIACHMPRKNMGLGYALTRYHRIGAPDDPARVERDRPLECALCHPQKSVGELAETMERWWGKRYDRARLIDLYGSLEAQPLTATLTRGKAHEQAVAVAVLGEARRADAAPGIARQLANPFPLVRYYARKSLDQILSVQGRRCAIDLDVPTGEIAAAAQRCVPGAFPDALSTAREAGPPKRVEPDED
jgi:predicted CXXCH cytochrome family protein